MEAMNIDALRVELVRDILDIDNLLTSSLKKSRFYKFLIINYL